MTWYPECAATPETDEPTNFAPPTMGNFVEPELKRLRESRALAKVTKEAGEFHAKMSKRYGVESGPGLAHARAARAYKESHQKLLEFFENGSELGELPPEVLIKANFEAVKWHKQMAEKHGVDSDEGHAHVAMMEHHMDVMNKAKQQKQATASKHGVSGRENPIAGVPEKKKQPSGDIRQNKPLMKLRGKNLANKEEAQEYGVKGMKWGQSRGRLQRVIDKAVQQGDLDADSSGQEIANLLRNSGIGNENVINTVVTNMGREPPPEFGPEGQAQKSAMMKQYKKDRAKHQKKLGKARGQGTLSARSLSPPHRAELTKRVNRLRRLSKRFEKAGNVKDSKMMKDRINKLLGESGRDVKEHGEDGSLNQFLKGQARRQGTAPRVAKPREGKYLAPRYDKSHPEGQYEGPRYTKSHESRRLREGKRRGKATFGNGVPMKIGEKSAAKEAPSLPPGFSKIGNVVFKEF